MDNSRGDGDFPVDEYIKKKLEETVVERTRSLKLAHELLDKLPLPVLGISSEEIVVYANEAVHSTLPWLGQAAISIGMQMCFPPKLAQAVSCCLGDESDEEVVYLQVNERKWWCHIRTLKEEETIRGCVIVIGEVDSEQ